MVNDSTVSCTECATGVHKCSAVHHPASTAEEKIGTVTAVPFVTMINTAAQCSIILLRQHLISACQGSFKAAPAAEALAGTACAASRSRLSAAWVVKMSNASCSIAVRHNTYVTPLRFVGGRFLHGSELRSVENRSQIVTNESELPRSA